MGKTKKQKKWIRLRHKIITFLARGLVGTFTKIKYGLTVEKFAAQGKRQYVVLFNHQTAFDQFIVGMAFKGPIYYVASEDIFSNGISSALIKYAVAPIPIRKQATDPRAVINIMRVAKEGGTIALSPEGNRTFSGKTEYINKALIPLLKKLDLPVALMRIEGGYGVHPRWSDVIRKGKMHARVSRVVEPEEYKQMSADELFSVIEKELYVNEANAEHTYTHDKLAEYLERAIYVCPDCGLSTFESHGDLITCKKCGKTVRYLPTTELEGVGCKFPFAFVNDWYEYQCNFINHLDVNAYNQTPMYEDTVRLTEVIPFKNKVLLGENTQVKLYGNRIEMQAENGEVLTYPFDKVSAVTVLGKNKVNVYMDKRIYQMKGNERFNALRYVNTYYRYKNIQRGDANDKFLGL